MPNQDDALSQEGEIRRKLRRLYDDLPEEVVYGTPTKIGIADEIVDKMSAMRKTYRNYYLYRTWHILAGSTPRDEDRDRMVGFDFPHPDSLVELVDEIYGRYWPKI
ncbi:MAG: hypothetical protein WCV79_00805 [Candidatus Paceibacterota bacterium]